MSSWSKFGVFIIIFGEDTFLVKFQKTQLKFQCPYVFENSKIKYLDNEKIFFDSVKSVESQ